jgi:hypothetical protein
LGLLLVFLFEAAPFLPDRILIASCETPPEIPGITVIELTKFSSRRGAFLSQIAKTTQLPANLTEESRGPVTMKELKLGRGSALFRAVL